MAYTYLDEDNAGGSGTMQDDWSWSALHGTRLRDNIAEIRDTRSYCAAAIHHTDTEGDRWASQYPVPWHLQWVYVPERSRTLTVRLYVSEVALANEAGGTDAIALCATTIRPSGVYAESHPPPSKATTLAVADPVDPDYWTMCTSTTTDQVVSLAARVADHGRPGWVGVVVWTWSEISDTAEDTGTIDGADPLVSVAELSTATMSAGVPERVLSFTKAVPQHAGSEDSDVYLIGYHDTFGGTPEYYAALWPECATLLATTSTSSAITFSTYSLGVVEVSGLDIAVTPDLIDLPPAEAYQIDTPIRESAYISLADSLAQLIRCRVPTWLSCPFEWLGTAREGQVWFGAAGAASFDDTAIDSTAFVALTSCHVGASISDGNGYRGIISWYQHWGLGHAFTTQMIYRLMAYTLGAAPATLATGTEARPQVPIHQTRLPFPAQDVPYDPIQHGLILWARYGDWALRGAIPGKRTDWLWGLRQLTHVEVDVDESGITYPCELRLECKTTEGATVTTAVNVRQVLVGAGIASQQRSW